MESIRVQRANVILDIDPDLKDKYLDEGFSVIDKKTGEITEKAIPTDVNTLRSMVVELQKEIEEKDKKIDKLKAKIKENK